LTHGPSGPNPRPKGSKGRPTPKLFGRPAMFYVGLAHGFEDTCLHEEEKNKEAEKVGGGHSTRLADRVVWPASHLLVPN
jgi:hypothetical protein